MQNFVFHELPNKIFLQSVEMLLSGIAILKLTRIPLVIGFQVACSQFEPGDPASFSYK